MAVSVEARPARAKVMAVSTCPRHRPAKATPVSDNHTPGQQAPATPPASTYTPAPQKTRMQFDWVKIQQSLKTLQFQRSYFKIRKDRGGIACEIGCERKNVGSDHWMRILRDEGARLRRPWAVAGPGCGTRGRWQGLAGQHTDTPTDWRPPRGLRGLAGQRVDAPSEARSANGSRRGRLAGGLPPTGTTSSPALTLRRRAPGVPCS